MVNEVQIVSLYIWTCEGARFATKTGSKVKDVRMEDGRKGALKAGVETAVSCLFFWGPVEVCFLQKSPDSRGPRASVKMGSPGCFSESPTKNEGRHGDHCGLGSTPNIDIKGILNEEGRASLI